MALPDYPITRNEHYLASIAGQEVELPDHPITREEHYLAAIAEGGGGGAVTSVNGKTGDVELVPSDLGIGTVFQLKGSKATVADLPASGNTIGDVWYVTAESVGYIWLNDGTTDRWEQLGLPVDLSAYYTKTETDAAIAADIAAIPTKAMVVTYDDDTTETFNVLTSPTE